VAVAPRPATKRRSWIIGVALFALFAGVSGYLVGNEVQVNTQSDQAHASVDQTEHHFSVALSDLATVRRDLHLVNGQVGVDTTALAKDTAVLNGVRVALVKAQATVSQQDSAISDLATCLSGVEQSLNAFSVGDSDSGVSELNSVAAACQSAAATNG
jgi:hypothetical protein